MKKVKFIIFLLLIISFIIFLFFGIFGTSLSFLSVEEIIKDREEKNGLINTLKINNIDTIYDKNNNMFYHMVPEDYENNIYVLNLELEDGFKYKIIGETLNIIKVDYSNEIEVIIYNDEYYHKTKIQLTNLPLINIITNEEITNIDTNSTFTYINSKNTEKIVSGNTKIHVRGNTSKLFNKKSYKINFYNKNYTKEKKLYISNFYYGDSLILDGIYRDPSKIRNLLATDLWNDISNDFNNINMYSEFVELFINNEYTGLYILTEPVNRRKLNLVKNNNQDTSIVLKSQTWDTVKSDMDISNLNQDFYLGYELKYPNNEDMFSISWNKILSKLSKYYDSGFNSSYDIISSTWNIENYIDIVILNAFINNSDNNLYKNNYFYMNSLNDKEVYIQPWDMEYSFGLNFSNENELFVNKDINDYNKIYTNFKHKDTKVNELLIDRYYELRKNVLTKEYFDNLLDKYKNELVKGAALRDSNNWYEYDIEKEIEDVRNWIYNRIEYFDSYIESLQNE
ncbi:MAG: CotH kinase family protein [Bacilli bacterium]|nr:CotH kinase family protein [Bacilli bacterium]